MTLAWVIGGGGLLGTALRRRLLAGNTRLFSPQGRFAWGDDAAMQSQFAAAVQDFEAQAQARAHERWEIYWAAGLGTMGADRAQMAGETHALLLLLGLLAGNAALHARPGAIAYSGSAGAVWAACGAELISEDTPPATVQPYGLEKLHQEAAITQFAQAWPGLPVLLARISSLYGANQGLNKRQGLMSQVARSVVRRQPVQIFVPFDTIRDYIHADDAAARIVFALRALPADAGAQVRIVASEQPTTIAEIVATFRRLARTNPRIITSSSLETALYTRRVQFRSLFKSPASAPVCRSLMVGAAELLAHERLSHARASAQRATP